MSASVRRRRRRGFRLDDYVVGRLPVKRKQYTVWDLAVEGCGVRISSTTRSCVISVRLGAGKKFETMGRISPDSPYEYLRELAVKRIGELKRERRELPVELQSVEGRRRLIEGLMAIGSATARADRFICYTGLRRRAAAGLTPVHLIADGVLEFKSKTRTVRIPLSRQAMELIDTGSHGRLYYHRAAA
jgi:hypothetical protein